MIDSARHFVTVETLKRQIDAMERVKLNVLHWHLSDNEGFRVESRRYPRLQATGDGQFYTQAQVRELVAYAAERGVRIVPEFDVPGHTRAVADAYPTWPWPRWKPANTFAALDRALDPTKEQTYRFLDGLFGEMAGLFPDAYFHAGGDEVGDAVLLDHPHVQAFMQAHGLASKQALEGYFHQPGRRDPAQARQDHDRLGRSGRDQRRAQGRGDPGLADLERHGRRRRQGPPDHRLGRLLPEPDGAGVLPLRLRPARHLGRRPDARRGRERPKAQPR